MMNRILIVGDPSHYRDQLLNTLEASRFDVDVANDSVEAIEMFSRNLNKYGIVIVKDYMKAYNATDLVSYLKPLNPGVKTVVLSESYREKHNAYADAIVSYDTSMAEILKKIYKLSNNDQPKNDPLVLRSVNDDISIQVSHGEVTQFGEVVDLTLKEYRILCYLLKNRRTVVTRQTLIKEIWRKNPDEINERVIDLHVKNLRIKMQLTSLITLRGEGYQWNE